MSKQPAPPSLAEIMAEEMRQKREKEEAERLRQGEEDTLLAFKLQQELNEGGSSGAYMDEDEALARRLQEEEGGPIVDKQFEEDLRLAIELQAQLDMEESGAADTHTSQPTHIAPAPPPPVNDEDAELARLLQAEYDAEYNAQLDRYEMQQNQGSKVGVSMANYRLPSQQQWGQEREQDDFEDEEEEEGDDDWDYTPRGTQIVRLGDGRLVTKHDTEAAAKRNTQRMEALRGIDMGSVSKNEFRIAPQAFNDLRESSHRLVGREARVKGKEDRAVHDQVFDPKTRLAIQKMVNWGLISEVTGIISTGKEANVLHAYGGSETEVPEFAIKIFKMTLNEFKNRHEYIKDDYRFKDYVRNTKTNTKQLIRAWTLKEHANLHRMQRAGIPCPMPVVRKNNILAMSFIGKDHVPAPQLREAELSSSRLRSAYLQCISYLHTLFTECQLVHGDYSEYNLLYQDKTVYVIDVGQSVEKTHNNALRFLYRDCHNMVTFFGGKGVEVPSVLGLFALVTDGGIYPSNRNKERHIAELTERLQVVSKEVEDTYGHQDLEDGAPPLPILTDIDQTGYQRRQIWLAEEEEEEQGGKEGEGLHTQQGGGSAETVPPTANSIPPPTATETITGVDGNGEKEMSTTTGTGVGEMKKEEEEGSEVSVQGDKGGLNREISMDGQSGTDCSRRNSESSSTVEVREGEWVKVQLPKAEEGGAVGEEGGIAKYGNEGEKGISGSGGSGGSAAPEVSGDSDWEMVEEGKTAEGGSEAVGGKE